MILETFLSLICNARSTLGIPSHGWTGLPRCSEMWKFRRLVHDLRLLVYIVGILVSGILTNEVYQKLDARVYSNLCMYVLYTPLMYQPPINPYSPNISIIPIPHPLCDFLFPILPSKHINISRILICHSLKIFHT